MLTKEAINRYSLQLCLLGVTVQSGDMQRDASRQGAVKPGHRFRVLKSETMSIPLPLSSAEACSHVLEPCPLSSQLNQAYNQTADVLMCRPML